MKNIQIVLIILWLSTQAYTQSNSWMRTIGNNGYSIALTMDTLQDKLCFGGFFNDTIVFNTDTLYSFGGADGYVSLIDTAGNLNKSINWGGAFFDVTDFIEVSNNSIILAGQTTSSNYQILGNEYQKESSQDVFIAKINNSLSNVEWLVNDYNDGNSNFNRSLSTFDTLINISGFYGAFETRTYNVNGELLWNILYPTSNYVETTIDSSGIYAVVDSFEVQSVDGSPQGGIYKHKLMKYDRYGTIMKMVDIINYESPQLTSNISIQSVTTDSSGNIFIIGVFDGDITFDGFVYHAGSNSKGFCAKFDNSLNPDWFNVIGGDSHLVQNISIENSNVDHYITWSEKENPSDNSLKYYVSKFDETGNSIYTYNLPSSNTVVGNDVTYTNNSLYVCGLFNGDIEFNGSSHSSTGVFDIFISKLDSSSYTSINGISQSEYLYELYPNPTARFLNIRSNHDMDEIRVVSSSGKSLMSYKNTNTNNLLLDLAGLRNGLYFIVLGDDKTVLKFIKE